MTQRHQEPDWLFRMRFGRRNRLMIRTKRTTILFDTSTSYSKRWFYPRYRDGVPHEAHVSEILEDRLRPDSCFFDIGANLGYYSLLATSICTLGSVYAFEIDPVLIQEIQSNIMLNAATNLRVVHTAVWEGDGVVLGFSPHQAHNRSTNMARTEMSSYSVSSLSIDTFCRQLNAYPEIVKIDVEGAEGKVLRGMKEALCEIDVLLLELHPDLLSGFGDSVSQLFAVLESYGFVISVVQSHRATHQQPTRLTIGNPALIRDNCMLLCEKP